MDYLKKRATREGCVVDFDKWTFSIQRVRESYFGMPYRVFIVVSHRIYHSNSAVECFYCRYIHTECADTTRHDGHVFDLLSHLAYPQLPC